jgi:hypothetical protein
MEWSLITIVGPILLALGLAWAMLNNRRSRAEEQRTEEATRVRRAEEDRASKESQRGTPEADPPLGG